MLADRDMKLEEALYGKEGCGFRSYQWRISRQPGLGCFKMNKLDLAEQFLKRAVAFAATNATMYDHLGDLYYKTKGFKRPRLPGPRVFNMRMNLRRPVECARSERVKSRASIR
jgi:hypothetical protein